MPQHKIVQTEVIDCHLSDHNVILCALKGGVPKLPPRTKEFRSFKNYCKVSFVNDLKNIPWSLIDSVDSVDDAVFLWEKLFCDIADKHAPIQKKRLKGHSTPWVTDKLREDRRNRDYHLRKAHRTNSTYHWNMYKKLRSFSNREDRRLKSNYFCKLINDSKGDSSQMWKSLKKALPAKSRHEIPSLMHKRKFFSKLDDIVNILNSHFCTIGRKLGQVFNRSEKLMLPQRPDDAAEFKLERVTQEFVRHQILNMKPNKAADQCKIVEGFHRCDYSCFN